MIVRPSAHHGIGFSNQPIMPHGGVAFHDVLQFAKKSLNAFRRANNVRSRSAPIAIRILGTHMFDDGELG